MIRIKGLWKKNKRELVVGVVVSLVTAFILQAGNWFVVTAPKMGNSLFGTIKNIVYACAATQSNLNILSIIISSAFGALICYMLIPTVKLIELYREEKKIQKAAKLLGKIRPNDVNLSEKDQLDLFDKVTKNVLKKQKPKKEETSKTARRGIVLAILIMVILAFFTELFLLFPLDLVDKFEHDITAITPYVEEPMVQQLESDWVCMRSENEYKEIYRVINEIKQEHDLP